METGERDDVGRAPRAREDARRRAASAHVRGVIPIADARPELDFYRTPAIATRGLLSVEKIRGVVWDPCCGDGRIADVLRAAKIKVVATDLVDRGYGRAGVDFLAHVPRHAFDAIVANPPFTHAEPFARRAAELGRPFYLIGRLLWLEGRKKKALFREAGLQRVWLFSRRINIAPLRYEPKDARGLGGMIAFAWYAFEPGRTAAAPTLDWIDVDEILAEDPR